MDATGNGLQNALKVSKELILSAKYLPIMSLLKLAEDVSAYGLRAVISHIFPDGSKHPIALVIRTIISSERNYAQIEIGALALVFEVQHFHQCHHGHKFTLETDHKTLMIILDQRRDSIPCSSQTSTLDKSTLSILLKKSNSSQPLCIVMLMLFPDFHWM